MIKFLIVDDEPLTVESIAELLDWESHGYTLIGTAANGAQALSVIRAEKPDVVFTDIKMPVMDGLELCRELHQTYPEIKAVILTAYRDFDYAHRAMVYGVKDYLLKNQIEPDVVLPLLERLSSEILSARKQKQLKQHQYYQSLMLDMASGEQVAVEGQNQQCCCVLLQLRTPYILE